MSDAVERLQRLLDNTTTRLYEDDLRLIAEAPLLAKHAIALAKAAFTPEDSWCALCNASAGHIAKKGHHPIAGKPCPVAAFERDFGDDDALGGSRD